MFCPSETIQRQSNTLAFTFIKPVEVIQNVSGLDYRVLYPNYELKKEIIIHAILVESKWVIKGPWYQVII